MWCFFQPKNSLNNTKSMYHLQTCSYEEVSLGASAQFSYCKKHSSRQCRRKQIKDTHTERLAITNVRECTSRCMFCYFWVDTQFVFSVNIRTWKFHLILIYLLQMSHTDNPIFHLVCACSRLMLLLWWSRWLCSSSCLLEHHVLKMVVLLLY